MILSTVLNLFVVPVVYVALARLRTRRGDPGGKRFRLPRVIVPETPLALEETTK